MKQGLRIFFKPKTFFNQLQWSSNHWFFVLSFLILATVETQIVRSNHLYITFASVLQAKFGLGLDLSLWLIMATKLSLMLAGAFVITWIVYLVGSILGQKNSRRVFYRRLSVVFTVFLAGFTVGHFNHFHEVLTYASYALYLWGFVLGFIAVREQFGLNLMETALVASFSALLVASTWHLSNHVFESQVKAQLETYSSKATATRPSLHSKFGENL